MIVEEKFFILDTFWEPKNIGPKMNDFWVEPNSNTVLFTHTVEPLQLLTFFQEQQKMNIAQISNQLLLLLYVMSHFFLSIFKNVFVFFGSLIIMCPGISVVRRRDCGVHPRVLHYQTPGDLQVGAR
ncbi:uncharacterized protein LOC120599815 isoform X4 [Pteropus medius]|uniref:uncharacterized protein LOC120599815 isoform X4 n=1 Tax=Pteropus vampyrus TaxID=132908 RepID=UPI00196B87E6|nr:uncharacterized protein LOC120599815 isoform X4 [Pteropus giganteus]